MSFGKEGSSEWAPGAGKGWATGGVLPPPHPLRAPLGTPPSGWAGTNWNASQGGLAGAPQLTQFPGTGCGWMPPPPIPPSKAGGGGKGQFAPWPNDLGAHALGPLWIAPPVGAHEPSEQQPMPSVWASANTNGGKEGLCAFGQLCSMPGCWWKHAQG